MELMRLAVVTDDIAYGRALARGLQLRNRNFQITLFPSEDFCVQWKQEGNEFPREFDLILWDREELEALWGGHVVKLCPHPPVQDPGENRLAIYKYTPAAAMMAAMMDYYSALTGRGPAPVRPERMRVLAVASWQGGCGCTSVAVALGRELVRFYGQRVLYLSFEGMESTLQYMPAQEGRKHAGEYLYHLRREGGRQGIYLDSYLLEDGYGLMAFAPSPGCNPLVSAGEEDLHRFFTAIMTSGRFDTLVLDLGSQLPATWCSVLEYADRLVTVYSRRQPGREEAFRSYLGVQLPQPWRQQILRVYNPAAAGRAFGPEREEGGQAKPEEADLVLRAFPGSGASLEGRFEKDIHQLTELCYNNDVVTEEQVIS